jgi:hypothetical protein
MATTTSCFINKCYRNSVKIFFLSVFSFIFSNFLVMIFFSETQNIINGNKIILYYKFFYKITIYNNVKNKFFFFKSKLNLLDIRFTTFYHTHIDFHVFFFQKLGPKGDREQQTIQLWNYLKKNSSSDFQTITQIFIFIHYTTLHYNIYIYIYIVASFSYFRS